MFPTRRGRDAQIRPSDLARIAVIENQMDRIVTKPSRTGLLVLLIAALSFVAAGVFIRIVDNGSKGAGTNATTTARTASRP